MKRILILLIALLLAVPALAEEPPQATPTPAPAVDPQTAEAIATVDSFFYFWRVAGAENLLHFAAPSWCADQEDPQAALTAICAGKTPAANVEILSISGDADDLIRTVRTQVPFRVGGQKAQLCVLDVIVLCEEGHWYVDPWSIAVRTTLQPAAATIPVYVDGVQTDGYVRSEPIRMPGADEYKTVDFAVSTWRGDSFRTNAAAGSLAKSPDALAEVWHITLPAPDGLLFTEDIQPTIVQWPREIRSMLQINEAHKATTALKEVYLPTLGGSIHCLSLADGTQTRSPIRIGYPMTGSVTLHPLGFPTLIAGQASALRAHGMGHVGMRYISAIDGFTDRFVADKASTAFTTSALVDKNTNTAVFLSSGGWLFTETLDVLLVVTAGDQLEYRFYPPRSVSARVSEATVTTAPVMHENLLWLGNNAGQVICVDTTTMQPLWTAEVGVFVSSLAMRETADGLQLLAVTGLGEAHLVCLDPYTGSVTGDILLTLDAPGPCAASAPVVGQEGLDGLVFVNLTGTSDATANLSALCAIDMELGAISWRVGYPESDAPSAPVAVYDDEGNGFLVTAMDSAEGTVLILLEGQTGVIRATLTLEGSDPCSPAVYGDMLVIATNTEGFGHVYGVRLTPAEEPAPQPDSSEPLVNAFMAAWKANDLKTMLDMCAPSWVADQTNASVMLFAYRANRTPTAWECAASADGVALRVCLDHNDGSSPEWYTGCAIITEEDGQRWIDPGFILDLVPEE